MLWKNLKHSPQPYRATPFKGGERLKINSSFPPFEGGRGGCALELSLKTKFYWGALAFVPSSLLLGLTNFISTDIASVPLLWIIPLTVICFHSSSSFHVGTIKVICGLCGCRRFF
jgi:hypothetical protein